MKHASSRANELRAEAVGVVITDPETETSVFLLQFLDDYTGC